MNEPFLSSSEIQARYPNEWVLVFLPNDPRRADDTLAGHVLAHSPNLDYINQTADQLDLSAVDPRLYTVVFHTHDTELKELADTVRGLEYLSWRPYYDEDLEQTPASPPVPARPWWRFWR